MEAKLQILSGIYVAATARNQTARRITVNALRFFFLLINLFD